MFKIFTISTFLLLTFQVSSQDFDEAFLDSLPEDIKEQLLSEKKAQESLEEIQYRRPSTFIKKPEELDDKDAVFGSDVFSMMQSTLMPLNEPNYDSSYVLDFGDELELQLTGSKSSTTVLAIKRDGSVNLPELGKLFLSGLSLQKASDLIIQKYEQAYIGVNAYITLTNVRDIQILVAGNVYNPGPYILNGNSNIFHALAVSGGPSEYGSYRSINLIRGDKVLKNIDLYDLLIYGKPVFNTRLKSGDILFINPVQNLISLFGAFKRTGNYEIKNNESLSKIIEFANGISPYADINDITLSQIIDNTVKYFNLNNINELSKYKPLDETKIYLKKISIRRVLIEGAVKNPGYYEIQEGSGIYDLIKLAGGYNSSAYPFGGVLENEETKKLNLKTLKKVKETMIETIIASGSNSNENKIDHEFFKIIDELKEDSVVGRINAEFDIDILKRNKNLDIALQEGDKIFIPEISNHIHVYGNVMSPGTVQYSKDKTVNNYIESRGGVNSIADISNTYILHANGMVEKYNYSKNIFTEKSKKNNIYPGSVIFIPKNIEDKYLRMQALQGYTSILSSLGVSLASISVLKD
jgi:protein involved in polysaccharide export with SLBB domain